LTTTNTWDALQRLTQVAYPDGTFFTNSYYRLDLVKQVDRMGFSTSYGYNPIRQKVAETNALGNPMIYTYCECGALGSISDALGYLTQFTHDNQGNLTQVSYPDSYTVNNTYNLLHQLVTRTDSSGMAITNYYNNQGLPTVSSNSLGQVRSVAYDIDDRVVTNVDANNVSVGMTYDNLRRLLTRSYPDGGVEQYGYTPDVPDVTSYTNQIGNVVLYGYDAMNRKTNEVYVGVTTNSFVYDGAGDLLMLTDGKNQTTTWGFDSYGRVTNKVDAANNLIFVYQYDADNRLTNRWTPAKAGTTYRYAAVGNLTNVVYPVSSNIVLRYDALNRLTGMVDGIGTTVYGYDAAGQLLSEGGLWPQDTVSYSYNNRLRAGMSIAAPNASAWAQSYGYDSARRLTGITSPAGAFGYIYDPVELQRVDELTLPNGAVITNHYDGNARLLSTKLLNSSSSILDSQSYAYNQANQRIGETNTAGDYRNYTYDNEGELLTAIGKEAGGVTNRLNEQFGYGYDAAGNLNWRTNNAFIQNFGVNSLNELTQVTNNGQLTVAGTTTSPATNVTVNTSNAVLYADVTFASTNQPWVNGDNIYTAIAKDAYGRKDTNSITISLQTTNVFAYDLNGNMITNGTMVLDWNDENELIRITQPGAWKTEFSYDGKMRRRIRKEYTWQSSSWVQTNEVRYVWDGNVVIQERDANNLPQVTYTRGNDLSGTFQGAGGIGGLLARTDNSKQLIGDSFASAFYHADGNGNITAMIYPNQTYAAKYLYGPFGDILSMSGALAPVNTYGFSSMERYDKADILLYLYRPYFVKIDRWPNRDPLEEIGHRVVRGACVSCYASFDKEGSTFLFCDNGPILNYDSFGLLTKADCDSQYDSDMQKAKQAGLKCISSAIQEGLIGEVVWGAGGAIVGVLIGKSAAGAGTGLVIGTGINLGIDFCHLHSCEKKVDKMENDAKNARKDCYKNVGAGDPPSD
jgi:YD repeat-containing protein